MSGEEAAGGDGGSAPAAPVTGDLPAFVRMNVAGIGSSVLGAIVLLSLFIPWVIFLVTYDQEVWGGMQEEWESMSYTLLAGEQRPCVLASCSCWPCRASPRSYCPVRWQRSSPSQASSSLPSRGSTGEQVFAKADFIPPGVGAATLPSGALLATLCFFAIFVLQLIPRLNKPRSKG